MGSPQTPNATKVVKYTMLVKKQGEDDSTAWEEPTSFIPEWEEDGWTAQKDADEIVAAFNNSLRPGEAPRQLVSVIDIEETEEVFPDEEE